MKRSPLKRKTALKARKPMKRSRKKAVPKEIRDHWNRVASLGCAVTFNPECQIHHVHGGSVRERWGAMAMPGVGQKQNDWLVVGLHHSLHVGINGVDSGVGVKAWESRYGRQVDLMDQVRDTIKKRFGYDVYEKAGLL
jgi:hypothetical protein